MRKPFLRFTFFIVLMICFVAVSQAQMRNQEARTSDYSGPIIKKHDPSDGANLGNLFNVKMSNSFSMNFGSVGGHAMNLNVYTNSMRFFFNEKLTGQVDVSLLNSPFGSANLYNFGQDNTNKLQVALNAQLDYQISKNMDLHFEVNRLPDNYGYYPGIGNSAFGYRSFQRY